MTYLNDTLATMAANRRPARIGLAIGDALGSLITRFGAWRAHRRTRRMLMAFDDRTLRDIGVDRGEIEYAIVHGRSIDATARMRAPTNSNAPAADRAAA